MAVQDRLTAADLARDADPERAAGDLLPAHEVVGEAPVIHHVQVRLDRGVVDHGDHDRNPDAGNDIIFAALAVQQARVVERHEAVVVPDMVAIGHDVARLVRSAGHLRCGALLRAFLDHLEDGFRIVAWLLCQVAHLLLNHLIVLDKVLAIMDVVATRRVWEAIPDTDLLRRRHLLFEDDHLLLPGVRVSIHLHGAAYRRQRATDDTGAKAAGFIHHRPDLTLEVALLELVVDPQLSPLGRAGSCIHHLFERIHLRLCRDRLPVRTNLLLLKLDRLYQRAWLLGQVWHRCCFDRPRAGVGRAQHFDHLAGGGLDVRAGDVQENLGTVLGLWLGNQRTGSTEPLVVEGALVVVLPLVVRLILSPLLLDAGVQPILDRLISVSDQDLPELFAPLILKLRLGNRCFLKRFKLFRAHLFEDIKHFFIFVHVRIQVVLPAFRRRLAPSISVNTRSVNAGLYLSPNNFTRLHF